MSSAFYKNTCLQRCTHFDENKLINTGINDFFQFATPLWFQIDFFFLEIIL